MADWSLGGGGDMRSIWKAQQALDLMSEARRRRRKLYLKKESAFRKIGAEWEIQYS